MAENQQRRRCEVVKLDKEKNETMSSPQKERQLI
jgi:hypothetical protein